MPFKDTGVLLLKLDGQIAFGSTYVCELVGIKHDKIAGMSFFDFVFPEEVDAARNLFDAAEPPHAEPRRFRLRRLDGSEVWTNIQARSLKIGPGDGQDLRHNSHDHGRTEQSLNQIVGVYSRRLVPKGDSTIVFDSLIFPCERSFVNLNDVASAAKRNAGVSACYW